METENYCSPEKTASSTFLLLQLFLIHLQKVLSPFLSLPLFFSVSFFLLFRHLLTHFCCNLQCPLLFPRLLFALLQKLPLKLQLSNHRFKSGCFTNLEQTFVCKKSFCFSFSKSFCSRISSSFFSPAVLIIFHLHFLLSPLLKNPD